MFGSSDIENPSTDSSPLHGRAELSSPVQQHMLYQCTDESFQEQSKPTFLCSYPCLYSLDLLPLTPEDTPASYHEMMDLDDISDFQDVMTTTSNEDTPDLDDVFGQ